MRRSLSAFFLATVLIMAPAAPALACSCGMYESAQAQVEATEPFLCRQVRALVELQLLNGSGMVGPESQA